MKTTLATRRLSAVLFAAFALVASVFAAQPPETTPDGLTLVKDAKADLVYRRPGVSFAGYTKVLLVEPTIAFRKNWQTNIQMETPARPVSAGDMEKMIAKGKGLLLEEFAQELVKGGYTIAGGIGPDVIALKPAILDLDVYAPDPSGQLSGLMSKTYTDGAGDATLVLELYDSETGQLLARAFDRKSGEDDNYTWSIPRNQASNTSAARNALGDWAAMFVKGLDRAKTAKTP